MEMIKKLEQEAPETKELRAKLLGPGNWNSEVFIIESISMNKSILI